MMKFLLFCSKIGRPRVAAVSLMLVGLASAQPEGMFSPGGPPSGAGGRPPVGLRVDVGSTGEGDVTYLGRKRAGSDATSITATLNGAVPLGEGWIMPLSLSSQNIALDEIAGVPVPDSSQTLSFGTGLGRRLDDEWMLMGRIGATLYRFDGARLSDIGVSGGFNAVWRYSPKLTWLFGVMFNPDSDLPVLPFVGANWAINDRVTLALMFPEPRLTYRPDKDWSFHIGANLNGAVFRTDADFGTKLGQPRYNNALGSYRDIRAGVGFGYKFTPSFSLEADAGYSLDRQIKYERIGQKVEFESAPYFRAGVKIAF